MNPAQGLAGFWGVIGAALAAALALTGNIQDYVWAPLFAVGASVVYGAAGAVVSAIEKRK